MKKKLIILLALLVFLLPFMNIQQANAAVAGKVVNETAKKVAKEMVKDAAIQMSFNMVLDPKYRFTAKDGDPVPKTGFTMVCMPRDKKVDDTCAKPIEMKKDLNEADKKIIAKNAEINLEKKIAGGIGLTKWGKFLDWFIPISAIGIGAVVLEGVLTGDLGNFFDEIAYDSIVGSDLMVLPESANTGALKFIDGSFYSAISKEYTLYVLRDENLRIWQKGSISPVVNSPLTVRIKKELISVSGPTSQLNLAVGSSLVYTDEFKYLSVGEAAGVYSTISHYFETNKDSDSGLTSFPKYTETSMPPTIQTNKPVPMIGPGAVPLEQISTGKPVIPFKRSDGTTGYTTGIDEKTGLQIEVEESDVVVKDPVIIQNPDGSETVLPAPTPQNPMPKPGDGEVKPPVDDPGSTPEFPEGESCSDSLKLPKILPLFHSLSTSFPFSIPWDLKSGFDAVFSEMGKEKPEFSYKFEFNGSQKEWKLSFPSYFDTWKPFTDSMLIFVFDVGLVYAIYRLMQGGGS